MSNTTAPAPQTLTETLTAALEFARNEVLTYQSQCEWHAACLHEARNGIRAITSGTFQSTDLTGALMAMRSVEDQLAAADRSRIALNHTVQTLEQRLASL